MKLYMKITVAVGFMLACMQGVRGAEASPTPTEINPYLKKWTEDVTYYNFFRPALIQLLKTEGYTAAHTSFKKCTGREDSHLLSIVVQMDSPEQFYKDWLPSITPKNLESAHRYAHYLAGRAGLLTGTSDIIKDEATDRNSLADELLAAVDAVTKDKTKSVSQDKTTMSKDASDDWKKTVEAPKKKKS